MANGTDTPIGSDADSIPSQKSTDSDSIPLRGSTDSDSPPPEKKPKIEEDCKAEPKIPSRLEPTKDPECTRQRDLLFKQFEDSEGFDVDWESFDYRFNINVKNFDWVGPLDSRCSNEELMEAVIQKSIEEHDDEYGTKLAFGKYVSANLLPVKGLIYFLTFSAKDLNSPNQGPKLYQAKVWKFADDISVLMVWPRLTPQLPS